MKVWFSRFFFPFIASLLILSSMALASYRVPQSPPPPIYRVLNSRARVMGVKEFLRISAVDINTANREQLMEIPSIGERLSLRIITYREANGDFAAIEELSKVKGIGDRTVRLLKEYAYVNK